MEGPEKLKLLAIGKVIGERLITTGLDSTGKASKRAEETKLRAKNMISWKLEITHPTLLYSQGTQ